MNGPYPEVHVNLADRFWLNVVEIVTRGFAYVKVMFPFPWLLKLVTGKLYNSASCEIVNDTILE
jgi:hypothetical protein